jgi:LCP family protein required for cell wall assembly
MAKYRVYRVGEAEPVRIAGRAPRAGARARRPSSGRHVASAEAVAGRRAWLFGAVLVAAVALAGFALWFFGRDAVGNAGAALGMVNLSHKVPRWAVVGAPVVAIGLVAAVTGYLAFGRHMALKVVGLAVIVIALATPGLALGWANHTVEVVGQGDSVKQAVVTKVKASLTRPLPGKAMNILLIGSDKSKAAGDPGRSDTQMLVRLDPATKSVSMLSVPRDLQVYVDGVGLTKMNAAYSYGGDAGAVKAFKNLTGLPINHFVEIDFAGFWHVVNILGGVYLPVDHRYFVPESASYKSIDLQAGYQLVHGKQALNFVRFRHDQNGDFTRMMRQQLFLRELQRQSSRWSGDWHKVLKLIKAITGQTTSDIDSLKKLEPLVNLIFEVNTSKINSVHLEGSTPMINGQSYVTATADEVAQVVNEFKNPTPAVVPIKGAAITKKMYQIKVYNGSGIAGRATAAANQLSALGYSAAAVADAPEFPDKVTAVYAPRSLATQAQVIGAMMWPSDVRLVDRAPGVDTESIRVFVASSFDGTIVLPKVDQQAQQTLEKNVRYDASSWRALDAKTLIHLEMPTVWSSGFTYNEFRSYAIDTTHDKRAAAAVVVVNTPSGGYWSIQAMRWLDPPAIQDPNATQLIAGTRYMLFYQGSHLHMVAWKRRGTLYWVLNTLDNQLTDGFMLSLATSFKPVK